MVEMPDQVAPSICLRFIDRRRTGKGSLSLRYDGESLRGANAGFFVKGIDGPRRSANAARESINGLRQR